MSGLAPELGHAAVRGGSPGRLLGMRRLWLLLAFAILVVIDLSILPTLVLGVFAGSLLTAGSHQGRSFLPVMATAVVLGAMFIGLTFVVGRAWRKAPRPSRSD